MEEKEKISQNEIERISQLAQTIDKIKTEIDQFVDKMSPSDKRYTLGVFWSQYNRAFKIVCTVFFIIAPTIWAIFVHINKIENKFEEIYKKEIEIIKILSDTQGDVDDILMIFKRATPYDVMKEVQDLRRKIFEVRESKITNIESATKENGQQK